MMTVESYGVQVRSAVEQLLKDCEVGTIEVVKINDQKLIGITVKKKDVNAGPTFYANEFFDEGVGVQEAAGIIAGRYREVEDMPIPDDADKLSMDMASVEDKLTIRVLEMARNKEFLKEVPYMDIGEGLAIHACINLGECSITVNRKLAEDWDIDDVELMLRALVNAERVKPAVLKPMTAALFGGEDINLLDPDHEEEELDAMYVLSTDGLEPYGASVIAYDGMLTKIARALGTSYYILPSSLHELIILPDKEDMDVSGLKKMVLEANRTVVAPYDVLSDNVYFYDAEEAELKGVA